MRAKEQKVVGLRRFLGGHAKSDRLDAITLAKLPLLDPEHLTPLVLPSPELESLDRLTRRRDRLAASIGTRLNSCYGGKEFEKELRGVAGPAAGANGNGFKSPGGFQNSGGSQPSGGNQNPGGFKTNGLPGRELGAERTPALPR